MLLLLLACATCDMDSVPRVEDTDGPDPFDVTTTTYTCEDTELHAISMEGYSTHAAAICYETDGINGGWECDPQLASLVGVGGSSFCVGSGSGGGCTALGMADLCEHLADEEQATDVRLILHRVR
jgi:hypothetical protein